MTYFYVGLFGVPYKGNKYLSLNSARKEAIRVIESVAVEKPKVDPYHVEVYRGNVQVGIVTYMSVQGRRKYYWQTDNHWDKLNTNGEKVEKARDWHPFGL